MGYIHTGLLGQEQTEPLLEGDTVTIGKARVSWVFFLMARPNSTGHMNQEEHTESTCHRERSERGARSW